jgi:phosphohistidine phosphatase
MKKLIFVRHGKAEDLAADVPDSERSLTGKGKAVSRSMAMKMAERENLPGILISSPALRALETALIFAAVYKIAPEKILLNSKLYYKMNFSSLLEILSSVSEDTATVTLFGHNPSLTDLADNLCIEGCDFIPKSGIACVSFNIMTWSQISRNSGKMEYFLIP